MRWHRLIEPLMPKPRKRFGQHFLTNPQIVEQAVSQAGIAPEDILIEVGPGHGILTNALRRYPNELHAVEIDRDLFAKLHRSLGTSSGVTLHRADILSMSWEDELLTCPGNRYKIISNLPYNISTPFLLKFLQYRNRFKGAVIMLQREFAERITGESHQKKDRYGSLSVLFSLFFERRVFCHIPPEDFYPPPQVWSSMISLTPNGFALPDEDAFADFVRDCFIFKRKMLAKSLQYYCARVGLPVETLQAVAKYWQLRPDNIPAADYVDMFRLIHANTS